MDNRILDKIVDNILSIKPILFKNLIKPEMVSHIIPAGSYHLFIILEKHGTLSMTEIGKELTMPKPNVTSLIDKLIDSGFVERIPDLNDRRIVKIQFTISGKKAIDKAKIFVRENIKEKLLMLSDGELALLADSLQTVKEILSKILLKIN